jgi:PhnB protein
LTSYLGLEDDYIKWRLFIEIMDKEVKPIPAGYHTLTPYIVVDDTGKAINFYKRAFGAKEIYGNYTSDGKSIIYAEIKTGDSVLMMSDELPHSYC